MIHSEYDIFSPTRPCKKCGSEDIRNRYVSAIDVAKLGNYGTLYQDIADTIKRECLDCHYVWHERPLDQVLDNK